MAFSIRDPAVDADARELAALGGESLTDAVGKAVKQRLEQVKRQQARAARSARLHAYIERGRARKLIDARPAADILGYNQEGVPS